MKASASRPPARSKRRSIASATRSTTAPRSTIPGVPKTSSAGGTCTTLATTTRPRSISGGANDDRAAGKEPARLASEHKGADSRKRRHEVGAERLRRRGRPGAHVATKDAHGALERGDGGQLVALGYVEVPLDGSARGVLDTTPDRHALGLAILLRWTRGALLDSLL